MSEPYPPELQQARAALWQLACLGGENTQLAMRYIGLFAPINDKISFEQIYNLLQDLTGVFQDYTNEAWQSAVKTLLAQKISGSLAVPLKDHDALLNLLADIADAQRLSESEAPITSTYPANTQLTPKPEQPKATPPTAEQKAKAAQYVNQMHQVCNRIHKYQVS